MKEKNQRLYQNLKPYIIVSFRSMKRLPATKPILKITESNTETERERERERNHYGWTSGGFGGGGGGGGGGGAILPCAKRK